MTTPPLRKRHDYHHSVQIHIMERNGKAVFACLPATGQAEDMWPLDSHSAPGLKCRGKAIMTSMGCECL